MSNAFSKWGWVWVFLLLPGRCAWAESQKIPAGLPQYDLTIHLDVDQHRAQVHERVVWTNTHTVPANEVVFNVHSHFKLPDKDVPAIAKTVELLRLAPSDAIDAEGHACTIHQVSVTGSQFPGKTWDLDKLEGSSAAAGEVIDAPHYRADNATALEVPLPRSVPPGETVTIDLEFTMRLPQKQGRWGQWRGVTFLSNWHPVLAYFDEKGWQPTPFVPWHQPFFNEAGSYTAHITLPCDQTFGCTGSVLGVSDLGTGWKHVEIGVACARDFAFLCSDRFCEFTGQTNGIQVRCVAFPEHKHYAKEMVRIACEAIPVYSHWFGPYPYPEFTIVESYFGWNGNECSGLIMIDERVFDMPHLACGFVDYLVSHEVCHQWWYNTVGTNGYCETWMDEGMATYFSDRLMTLKTGQKNSRLLAFPQGLEWLPNIDRQTYRHYGLYGTLGRGEAGPSVQPMEKYNHVINLFSLCYDRGNKIVGMIEDRLGETAFFDFMRLIYRRYYFRILRVADFQRELEAYTGRSWEEFFQNWLYGKGMTDWAVTKVTVEELGSKPGDWKLFKKWRRRRVGPTPCQATVLLTQKAEYNEETVLGFCLDGGTGYQIRIPILPQAPHLRIEDPPGEVEWLSDHQVRVEVQLPCQPTQIAVDPDQILVDRDPANNFWKMPVRWRITPLYTMLDETDLTTAYDRWNVTLGPWIYGSAYDDPWYTRSMMGGVRLGAYRTQQFDGGVYLAYRTDYRDVAAGVDGLWDHWPWSHTQIGFNAERSLSSLDDNHFNNRAMVFGRYVFLYGSSLYLPPIKYLEVFGAVQDHNLPEPRYRIPDALEFDTTTSFGIHYHVDYLTPYWDPEAGFRLDATYATGIATLGENQAIHRISGQLSFVKGVPEGLGYLSETRIAARLYGAAGLPTNGELFPLGGAGLFRGFDLAERQGSVVWVGSVEWRFPLLRGLTWDWFDHTIGLRNVYGVAFYDVGNAYLNGHALGEVAHAVGGGLALDVTWFSFVERTTIRLDVAQTLNSSAPLQFNFYFQHPF
jgi:hypothetical protein